MAVFVIGKHKKPLMPCSEKRARLLLARKRAVVARLHPFTIRLKDREEGALQTIRLSYDPGSSHTGIAVARVDQDGVDARWLGQIEHRGDYIKHCLKQRSDRRRRRRSANLRYRAPRFNNRTRPAGWLPPSLQSRVDNIAALTGKLRAICPITEMAVETARFDTQLLQNPLISGVEYQQGTLQGFEVREWVLEHWGRKCVYCGRENVPLQLDHVIAKGNNGSNRVSNLVPSCRKCNELKSNQPVEKFLQKKPAILARILSHIKEPLRDAAAATSTRWAAFNSLKTTGLPVEMSSGGRTKWNRWRFDVPKSHSLDALCVGTIEGVNNWQIPTLIIKAMGRGSHKRTRFTEDGFPRGYLMRSKQVYGFQTGDLVRATVTAGKKQGIYQGRLAVRADGNFNIQMPNKKPIQGINYKYCRLLSYGDGYTYSYQLKELALPPRHK
jgi:5-methylcytosine-specific restriction endonuclease McrA